MGHINWARIGLAVQHYQSLGFEYIETPWIVDRKSSSITCPDTARAITTDFEYTDLVGSAEQGFIHLCRTQQMPEGVNFVSCGPCFRWERPFDELHQLHFMKVELFSRLEDESRGDETARELCNRANRFVRQFGIAPEIVETDEGYDLEVNGIEIGSYGYRTHEEIGTWAYGTGLAEPRLSIVMESKNG
jgi:seryl-tRNA synthetase